MGEAAAAADRVVITNDNPRSEDPNEIAAAIRAGLEGHSGVDVILDRAQAIEAAVRESSDEDVVVVAGKGHETEQELGRDKRPFSDHEVVRAVIDAAQRP